MASRSVFAKRLERLQRSLALEEFEGVVMAPGSNVRYYTDVQSKLLERPFLLFVPAVGTPNLVAPTLEAGPYSRSPLEVEIHKWDDAGGPAGAFDSLRRSVPLRGRWGCEGQVPFGYLTRITDKKLSLEPADSLLQSIRETKDASEIASLRSAAAILSRAYLKIPEFARPGSTELEVAKALREVVLMEGGESIDFCDVQAGKHAADPHWAPSSTKLRRDEGFLIDAGCTVGGYNADITRTFVLGKNKKIEEAYADVLEGQVAGVKAVVPDARTGDVDSAARSRIVAAGRGKQFFHRTGHGLGLEIHEEPYIVSGGRKKLRPGMVFTVEPGVYYEGGFGVRIEDDVVVTDAGADVITSGVPKEFGWWR
jgi:Xaa-Pro aminopeptidase